MRKPRGRVLVGQLRDCNSCMDKKKGGTLGGTYSLVPWKCPGTMVANHNAFALADSLQQVCTSKLLRRQKMKAPRVSTYRWGVRQHYDIPEGKYLPMWIGFGLINIGDACAQISTWSATRFHLRTLTEGCLVHFGEFTLEGNSRQF